MQSSATPESESADTLHFVARAMHQDSKEKTMPASSTTRFKSNFPKVYFRGTPNHWDTSEMALIADNTWELSVTFAKTTDERFKFDVTGDWSHSYGGAGTE